MERGEAVQQPTSRDVSRIKAVLTMILDMTYRTQNHHTGFVIDLICRLVVRFEFTQNKTISKEYFCDAVRCHIDIPLERTHVLTILNEELDIMIEEMQEVSMQCDLSFVSEPTWPEAFYPK
ncbi:hypothetical protein RF11_02048 [Thelohanellus kitauei]|uniref:Uncharacterized protein n=1 Tax=Thelohanellus kitauei TaxID=669202 RepID=A0A0C2MXQ0_THEKT|nr:hypothetical protein RF11_02048 [Thelohanellus kitauei]